MMPTVLLGGTFDPVHNGHLDSAREIADLFAGCRVTLIPCLIPPHREVPGVSAEDRLEMIRLAVAQSPRLSVDERELRREGVSYTIETLRSFRQQLGQDRPLIFVLGSDAWATLPTWHDWQSFTDYAHLLIIERPGAPPAIPQVLERWAEGRWVATADDLTRTAAGGICRVRLSQIDISATEIRRKLAAGDSVEDLLPDVVRRYIAAKQLYLSDSADVADGA